MTVNLVAVTLAILGAVFLKDSPVTSVQLLWVNMIMDTMGALALATSSPTEKLLDRPPHSRHAKIINRNMWKHILVQGTFQIILLIIIVFAGETFIPEEINSDLETQKVKPGLNGMIVSGRPYYLNGEEDYMRYSVA